jgi:formylglycine-generating enzyme required for sulfatase activity
LAEIGRGLAAPEAGVGTLIGFSTQPGNVALDGTGRTSPYSGPLAKALGTAGKDLSSILIEVRNEVFATTGGKQVPWEHTALMAPFYFNSAGPAPKAPEVPLSKDAQAWIAVQNATSEAVLEEFTRRFPDSVYASFAKARLEELKRSKAASGGEAGSSWWPFGGRPEAEKPKETQTAINVPPKPVAPAPEAACDGLLVTVAMGRQPCIKPGSGVAFKDCPECPEMVVVPEGSFDMGSPGSKPGNEGPQHQIRIGKPFAVGRFAVTFAEWDACVAGGGCGGYKPSDMDWGRADRPVINVNWNDAKSYLNWLTEKSGATYRLLSEAEREYVTRAGTSTEYWWGNTISKDKAIYLEPKTVPVKSFDPNPWGLYQVHGNVYDWVEDCWHGSYDGAPGEGSAWTTGECKSRVLRGGSYFFSAYLLRAAGRSDYSPDFRYHNFGFRVARTITP